MGKQPGGEQAQPRDGRFHEPDERPQAKAAGKVRSQAAQRHDDQGGAVAVAVRLEPAWLDSACCLESAWFHLLKLTYDKPLSNLAFNLLFNLLFNSLSPLRQGVEPLVQPVRAAAEDQGHAGPHHEPGGGRCVRQVGGVGAGVQGDARAAGTRRRQDDEAPHGRAFQYY